MYESGGQKKKRSAAFAAFGRLISFWPFKINSIEAAFR